MIIRSKAPLRLGLGGGGTDVSPYCDKYGGCVLNATIDLYAYCTIMPTNNQEININATDRGETFKSKSQKSLNLNGYLDLHKGVYNRIIKDYNLKPLSFDMVTYSDAPAGSGLGTSSTVVVCILQAFIEWLNLPLGEYEIAQLAYKIEREDLALSGGKQDQYAAIFGGFNFIEFFEENRVIVNPLRIKNEILEELEASALLYFTGVSRSSAKIIEDQKNSVGSNNLERLNAMHQIKNDSFLLKEAILKGEFKLLYKTMLHGWEAKKNTSDAISNPSIDKIFDIALRTGAHCGKISGAGGGGFMFFFVDPTKRNEIKNKLESFDGYFVNFHFIKKGAYSWKVTKEDIKII